MIADLLGRLFGKAEFRVLIIGLDYAGRTSIVYRFKLGEVIQTVPTIGFNVETIQHKNCELNFWDFGGCDKIRTLWRHYYQNTDAIIYVVDSKEHESLLSKETDDEEKFKNDLRSAEGLLLNMLRDDELRDCVVLFYLNKQDLPNAMSVETFKERMKLDERTSYRGYTSMRGHPYHIQPCSVITGEGLYEGLDWLVTALQNRRRGLAPPLPPPDKEPVKPKEQSLLDQWMEREDAPDDVFLQQFHAFTLDSWDHYTHLRIAYLYLTQHGRQKAIPLLFHDIAQFIMHSPRTKSTATVTDTQSNPRGTTFHETMTYFWVHMVHYALATMKEPTDKSILSTTTSITTDQLSPFKLFLLFNPTLSEGGLFLTYYSRELMLMNPLARQQVMLPDKKPLPSLILPSIPSITQSSTATSSILGSSVGTETVLPSPPTTTTIPLLQDIDYWHAFQARTLSSWGHDMKLRILYVCLCIYGRGKGGVDRVLQLLEDYEGVQQITINYFWIQLLTYAIAHTMQSVKKEEKEGKISSHHFGQFSGQDYTAVVGQAEEEQRWTQSLYPFTRLYTEIQDKQLMDLSDSLLYLKYYSRKVIDSSEATSGFVLPDLQPLPSLVMKL